MWQVARAEHASAGGFAEMWIYIGIHVICKARANGSARK
jgi:hypothetical protein